MAICRLHQGRHIWATDLFFLDMGVRYSANSTLSCCTASSLEPCILYIHMKGSLFFCSPWQVCISQIFFRCWLLSLSFSSFVFFVTFQLLCSNQKICLQFCPIKSPHHEMPRKSLKSDALLQISSHAPSGESLSDFASVFLKLSYHLLWH